MMADIEEVDQPIETHVIHENEANAMEQCNEGKGKDESILGKVFDTPDDAYTFYNDYAFLHGFGIRIDATFKHKTTKEPYRKIYVCDKEGFKRLDDNASSGIEEKRRREVRIECKAELRISKNKDGKWFVVSFNDTHNHELSMTPTKVMKHRSHAKFHRLTECKSLMVELGQAGLKPCQVRKAINAMKTSTVADVTSKQCADVLSEQRKQYKGKEFYGLIKHFQDKALVDNDQYFTVDLCDDGSPKNIFWADRRSRDAYTKFSDVVVFDVTYMTNKFKMPFAPFVGVNHHGQSILFVFPKTQHRFCAWHIKKHENEHIKPYVSSYSDFKESYTKWVNSDTIEEFETRWEVMRHKYRLENNCWISDMYNQRIHWAKTFLKDVFLAVESRRAAEEDEDFKTMNSRSILSSLHPIEEKAGECYTRKIFDMFKKEWTEATSNLTHETISKGTEEIKYRVGQLKVEKTYWRIVTFCFSNEVSVTCSCSKYETCGILCKHCLYVMKKRHVETLPSHYILHRWTLNARYKVGNSRIGLEEINNENEVSSYTLWCVRSNFAKLIEQARDSPSEIQKLNNLLISLLDDQANRKKPIANESQDSCARTSLVDMMHQLSVRDPLGPTNMKGHPRVASRIKSSLEAPKNECVLTAKDWVITLPVGKMNRCKRKKDEMCSFFEKMTNLDIS
uniref:SWIM-type domain-containing protein n=1 Tax=Lactuca sativa TaxID=4236 RepID=A0A9R1VAH3_LACSA|nr:hypothetical protein LSAT_V11C500275730 [Lactuca sativa]